MRTLLAGIMLTTALIAISGAAAAEEEYVQAGSGSALVDGAVAEADAAAGRFASIVFPTRHVDLPVEVGVAAHLPADADTPLLAAGGGCNGYVDAGCTCATGVDECPAGEGCTVYTGGSFIVRRVCWVG